MNNWIPIYKGEPDSEGLYLVTMSTPMGLKTFPAKAWYGRGMILEWSIFTPKKYTEIGHIIAWSELPEPYLKEELK